MLKFQPPGFGQRSIPTSLGTMAYYAPVSAPWRSSHDQNNEEKTDEKNYPPLVFLHSLGGGSSAYEWSKVYPTFASTYQVIAPDLIGWGQSTHPVRSYRAEDYWIVITELLEWLGEPVPIVASSLTAGLIIRLAIQRPELFQMLFLVCPSGYAEPGAEYSRGIVAQLASTPGIDRLIYTLGAANEFAVRNFMENVLFADRSRITNEMVAAYLVSAQQFNADYAALASLRGDLCFDLERYIDQLHVPTFLVWGEKSRLGRVQLGKKLATLNPQAIKQLWTIADVGVLPQLEVPSVVSGLLNYALRHLPD